MAEPKTQATTASVRKFLESIEPAQKQEDAFRLLELFEKITGEKAVLWGPSIVGFGSFHYKSERSRQEGDWPLTGFSPRKANLTVYIMPGFKGQEDLLAKLGKHKTSVSCLYLNKLADVDLKILEELISESLKEMKKRHSNA